MKLQGSLAKSVVVLLALVMVAALGINTPAQAQEGPPQLQIIYMNWVQNDIIRNVEEIRRAKNPEERRELVEDIEEIIFEKVEFPLTFKQAEISDTYDLNRIGSTSDIVEGKEANPLAPEIAQCYALLGVAKGFEGFGVAASDYFEKAKGIYANVLDMTVSLDHSKDNRTLGEWISSSRGYWGNSKATRVTFYGKRVSQEAVDMLNMDNTAIEQPGRNPNYTLYVAKRDFVRGLKRYVKTDDVLKEKRINKFQIYLPPGRYQIKTSISSLYVMDIKVSRNAEENNYIVETLKEGISVYPIPDIRIFEEEMKKALLEAQELDESQQDATEFNENLDDLTVPVPE